MSIRSAQDAWSTLRRGGHQSNPTEVPSLSAGVMADAGDVRFALGPAGEGRLLLPLRSSERQARIPETPTLQIFDRSYILGGNSGRYLDLTCVARELDAVFAEVVGEIVQRISGGESALRACEATLREFRMLLVPGNDGADASTITGLIGELILLNDLLTVSSDAVALWRGPLGDRHDFRGGQLAIEVKTTSRAANQTISISSIDQLLEPMGGELCLAHFTLEKAVGGQYSVSCLFDQAFHRASDPAALRERLRAMGCADPAAPAWNDLTFELQDSRTYRIDKGFPRLVPDDIPAGLSDVRYDLDLSVTDSYRLDDTAAAMFRNRMIECLSPP